MPRIKDVKKFYELMDRLENRVGGKRILDKCRGNAGWPDRGVYFFFEPGEERSISGTGPRVVRIGTHAVSAGSQTTLWDRLRQHKGCSKTGGGNHRGSVFRKIVGFALMNKYDWFHSDTWGKRGSISKEMRFQELPIEREVSNVIRNMPFLWLKVDDEPSKISNRAYLERNSIALLRNWNRDPIDEPSANWLGRSCPIEQVKVSGLWNFDHVDGDYDPVFLDVLEGYIEKM